MNDGARHLTGRRQSLPCVLHGKQESERKMMHSTVWQCEQWFGGHVYEKKLFETREDAESFAQQLARVTPEATFRIAPVEMKEIWN